MKQLTNITFTTATNSWYAPTNELKEKYRSIIWCQYMDTTSSAGDWSGFIIQKIGKNTFVAIGFGQYNNYPHDGFRLMTCEHSFYKGKLDEKNLVENVKNCWLQFDHE